MPKARKHQVSLGVTPYYHCVSRCVRSAFLCGISHDRSCSFEHRRAWIESRILKLATIFAIDVCAYAVMSNHYHVVLHVDATKTQSWTDCEICERWHQLYKGTPLIHKYLQHEPLSDAESNAVVQYIEQWRLQLADISWFMRNINEPIARQANGEDNCTGRFWEGRFKSQALLDEQALAACLAYVDLNPVRADMAKTPEASDHTSVQRRIRALKQPNDQQGEYHKYGLHPFAGSTSESTPKRLPFRLNDYFELIEWTGSILSDHKRGAIPTDLPHILRHLNFEPQHWIFLTTRFESRFKNLVGCAFTLKEAAKQLGYKRTPGLRLCKEVFN